MASRSRCHNKEPLKYDELVSGDHRCKCCGISKDEGGRFGGQRKGEKFYPHRTCYRCRKYGVPELPERSISQKIKEYFDDNYK